MPEGKRRTLRRHPRLRRGIYHPALCTFLVVAGSSKTSSSALTGHATTQLLQPVQLLSMC